MMIRWWLSNDRWVFPVIAGVIWFVVEVETSPWHWLAWLWITMGWNP